MGLKPLRCINIKLSLLLVLGFHLNSCFNYEVKPPFNIENLDLPEGLVYYYTLDNHYYDSSPNKNDSEQNKIGKRTFVADRNGNENSAVKLEGSSIESPGNNNLIGNVKNQGFTVSFLVNLDHGHEGIEQQLFMTIGTQNFVVKPYVDKLTFVLKYYPENLVQEDVSYDLEGNYISKWVKIALTYDKNTVNLFINGEKKHTFTQKGNYSNPSLFLGIFGTAIYTIGSTQEARYSFYGMFDEIMGFNRPLTDQEVRALP